MSYISAIIITVLVSVLLTFLGNDLYACAPRFQKFLLTLAARLSPQKTEDAFNAYWGDLNSLPPSEFWRTFYALDCIRGEISISANLVLRFLAMRSQLATHISDVHKAIDRFDAKLSDNARNALAKRDVLAKIAPQVQPHLHTIENFSSQFQAVVNLSRKHRFLFWGIQPQIERLQTRVIGLLANFKEP